MILYRLICELDHEFDSWFRNSATFDRQAAKGVLQCPQCGTSNVGKAVMAPRVNRTDRGKTPAASARESDSPMQSVALPQGDTTGAAIAPDAPDLRTMLQHLRRRIEAECEYVGPRFAEEARAIADHEAEPRAIYGEATSEEVEALREDGIDVAGIPWVPTSDA